MKLQNTSHTTKGNCMPKLTIASLVCINLSCNGGYRDDLNVQLGASTLIWSAPSPEHRLAAGSYACQRALRELKRRTALLL